jgi:hypothetical protein
MTLSASDFTMERSLMTATDSRASRRSLLKPNGQKKIWVCTTESHPIQQSLGKIAQGSLPAKPFETQHSGQNKEEKHLVDLYLDARETR